MKNFKYYLLSAVMVLVFVTGIFLNARAEGEDSESDISLWDESYAVSSDDESEKSEEPSEDISYTESPAESDTESSMQESAVESSAESYIESSAESSDEISSEPSYSESSDESDYSEPVQSSTESQAESSEESSEPSVPYFEESSDEPSDDEPVHDSSIPEESSREQSSRSTPDESSSAGRVSGPGLRQDPLMFLSGIRSVIPANRSAQTSGNVMIESESPFIDNVSDRERPYTEISEISVMPVTETAPDAAAVSPPRQDNRAPFLIAIIVFSAIGMLVTISVILILRSRGEFTPSVFKFDKKNEKQR